MAYVGDHQFGIGAESTVGTAITPTNFLEVTDESIKLNVERVESKGLRTGRRVLGSTGWAAGNQSVTGDVSFEVGSKGFGLLFKHMLGTNTTTTPGGATTRRLHTAEVATQDTLALTCQVARTDVAGTQHKFTYAGCKVDNWELSGAISDFLQLKITVDGKSEAVVAGAPTTATYPTGSPLVYTGASMTIDGGAASQITAFSVKSDNGLAKERYFLGSAQKSEQVEASMRTIDGSFDCEWTGLTQYNKFINGTAAALVFKYETAAIIEGAAKGSVTITLPIVRFDGETPVGGGQILTQSIPFVALQDDTSSASPIKIEYVSLDTSI